MTFQIDAIYDGGVLRPLEPLDLLDQTRVTLYVEPNSEQVSAQALADQQAALDALRKTIDALPQHRNNDGWSVRQHDDLLYDELQ